MKKEPAIVIKDIHKEFVLPQHKNSSIKQTFVNIVRKNNKTVQRVLDGVSFQINKGDFFGVVGRNGSGKSTLLKILAGVYTPTCGEIKINGKLTPFIELGVGFNPELSGRDNVFLNGALLGFTRKQMEAMYDEIVEFAELEPFMDQKLKNYSSGMQVRLAFSVAIKARNEIMIFDEVLAVGDEAFQRKCMDIFEKYKATGQTVVLVTHDMETVKKFCNKAALIQDGKVAQIGNPVQVADAYSLSNTEVIDGWIEKRSEKREKKLFSARLNQNSYNIGQDVRLSLGWSDEVDADSVMLDLFKRSGEHITNFISSREYTGDMQSRNLTLDFTPMVTAGSYYMNVSLFKKDQLIHAEYEVCDFVVADVWPHGVKKAGGLFVVKRTWG